MMTRRRLLTHGGMTVLGAASACLAMAGDNKVPGPGTDTEALPDGALARGMITHETDRAIDRGLDFLNTHRQANGSFGNLHYQGNIAITSLAGLAFMAGGHQPNRGLYGKAVTDALRYVLDQSRRSEPPGYLHVPNTNLYGAMYGHGFGTLFLAEACGMVHDPQLRLQVRERLQMAVRVILHAQNALGGWRYLPEPRDADVSVTVCQMMALRSARNAGVAVPREKVDACIGYVKKCQNLENGSFKYQLNGGGGGTAFARTAAGVSALNSAGIYLQDTEGRPVVEVQRGLEYLQRNRPAPGSGDRRFIRPDMHYFYGHYYAVQAMWTAGGKYWSEWFPSIREELLRSQQADGSWQDMVDGHYATAMACIILQVPNNYLPILQK